MTGQVTRQPMELVTGCSAGAQGRVSHTAPGTWHRPGQLLGQDSGTVDACCEPQTVGSVKSTLCAEVRSFSQSKHAEEEKT